MSDSHRPARSRQDFLGVGALGAALLAAALAQGCHRPLEVRHDDLLLHATPEPVQPRPQRPAPAPLPPPAAPPYHPE